MNDSAVTEFLKDFYQGEITECIEGTTLERPSYCLAR